jgi:hypothetical protein
LLLHREGGAAQPSVLVGLPESLLDHPAGLLQLELIIVQLERHLSSTIEKPQISRAQLETSTY